MSPIERRALPPSFRQRFPDRRPLTPSDYAIHLRYLDGWKSLLAQYDVIQGYAIAAPMDEDAFIAWSQREDRQRLAG